MDSSIFTVLYCAISANRLFAPYLQHFANTTYEYCTNIVGYQNLETISGGYKMLTATFDNVANGGKYSMRDLKVNCPNPGWEWQTKKGGYWKGGISAGDFKVLFLNQDGTTAKTYYWTLDRTPVEVGYVESARWQKYEGGAYVDLNDAELDEQIDAGTGLWIAGGGNKFQPAGGVAQADLEFTTIVGGYVAVGNNTPVDLTLGDLSVICPNPNWDWQTKKGGYWKGGISAGDFKVLFLNQDGTTKVTYYWTLDRTPVETGYTESARWQKYEGSAYVDLSKEELAEIKIPAGQALWVAGGGNKLVIPGVEL